MNYFRQLKLTIIILAFNYLSINSGNETISANEIIKYIEICDLKNLHKHCENKKITAQDKEVILQKIHYKMMYYENDVFKSEGGYIPTPSTYEVQRSLIHWGILFSAVPFAIAQTNKLNLPSKVVCYGTSVFWFTIAAICGASNFITYSEYRALHKMELFIKAMPVKN